MARRKKAAAEWVCFPVGITHSTTLFHRTPMYIVTYTFRRELRHVRIDCYYQFLSHRGIQSFACCQSPFPFQLRGRNDYVALSVYSRLVQPFTSLGCHRRNIGTNCATHDVRIVFSFFPTLSFSRTPAYVRCFISICTIQPPRNKANIRWLHSIPRNTNGGMHMIERGNRARLYITRVLARGMVGWYVVCTTTNGS